jgi:hypothetical protein
LNVNTQFDANEFEERLVLTNVSAAIQAVRDVLVNDIVEFNKKVCRDGDADRFNDLQPGISKSKTETLGTQEMLCLKDNCGDAYKG